MKKMILFIALLFVGATSYSQNIINLFNKSDEFFALLAAGKYDTAHQYFDPAEQSKISAENLKQLWDNIKLNFGNVTSLDPVQSKVQGDFYVVTVAGKFERNEQDFLLVFNKSEKLVGLFMPPKAAAYRNPSYADTTLYKEQTAYLTDGKHQLAAVITIPKNAKNFPMVVLVHGSGPADMDGTLGPNKPLKDIAVGLASNGIGSLRYVKRTLLYGNEFSGAFTVKEETEDDAIAAIAMAKTVQGADVNNIYLLGHSLGGMLAPRLATLSPTLKGIILAAAPARKLTDVIIEQNEYMYQMAKDTTAQSKKIISDVVTALQATKLTNLGAVKPDSVIMGLPASYWVDLNNYDQVATANKLTKRILVVQGGNDFQVSNADYKIWEAALGKKANAAVKYYPTLNHLLSSQTEKGTSQQYQSPASVDLQLINDLAAWIKGK